MPDTTLQELEAQRNEILAAMQQMTSVEPEPGEVRVGDVVHAGDESLDTPMIVSGLKSAGVIYIYDTVTGERSRTNKNMLPTQLTKKREDGSLVFSMTKPAFEPKRGQEKCLLHPGFRKDHPEYDLWGLPLCMKENLASGYEVRSHMMSRHKRQWATIEEDRIERERKEDRELQRKNAEATQTALRAVQATQQEQESREPVAAGRGARGH